MKKIARVLVFVLLLTAISTGNVKAEGEGVTVYFYNSLGWKNVYVYSWTENSNAPEKTAMEPMEKKGWYSFTFDESMGKKIEFLFYNGEWGKTNQTENLVIKNGKSKYYFATKKLVDGENGKVAQAQGFAKKKDMVDAYKKYRKEQKAVEENNSKETTEQQTTRHVETKSGNGSSIFLFLGGIAIIIIIGVIVNNNHKKNNRIA